LNSGVRFPLDEKDVFTNKNIVQMPALTFYRLVNYVEQLEDKLLARGINLRKIDKAVKVLKLGGRIKKAMSRK